MDDKIILRVGVAVMKDVGKYSYKEKVEKLQEFAIRNWIPDGYSVYPEYELTPKEYLKLYTSKQKIEYLPSSFLYFQLDDEEKKKYINDLKDIKEVELKYLKNVKDNKLKIEIVRRLVDGGIINKTSLGEYDVTKEADPIALYSAIVMMLGKNKNFEYEYVIAMKELDEERRFSLVKRTLQNNDIKFDLYAVIDAIESFSNPNYKKNLSYDFLKRADFAQSDWDAGYRIERLFEVSFSGEENELLNFIKHGEVNKFVDLELAISRLPSEKIINYFETNGVDIDIHKLIGCFNNDNKWLDLYNYFDKLPNGYEYIDKKFLISGKGKCEINIYNKIAKKYVLNNKTMSKRDKIDIIINMYYGLNTSFNGVELLLEYFGNDIDIDLNHVVAWIDKRIDMKKFPKTIDYIEEKFNISNKENANKLFEKFGNLVIPYLNEENITYLINMEGDKFDKVLDLINENNVKLDNGLVNTAMNSLLQRRFRIEEDDYNIFSKFERLMIDKNPYTVEETKKLLEKIEDTINVYSIISKEEIDVDKLFKGDKEEIELLHKLTDAYIAKKREVYVANNYGNALDDLNVEKYYDKAYIKKNFFALKGEKDILEFLRFNTYHIKDKLTEEEIDFLGYLNINRLVDTIKFKKNPSNEKPSKEMTHNLKMLENIMNIYYEKRLLKLEKDPIDTKYVYNVIDVSDQQLLDILVNVNLYHMNEYLLNNDKMYNKLKELFEKYKFPGWGNTFEKLGNDAEVNVEPSMSYGLINYFDKILKIYSELPKKNQTLTALLDICNAYTSGPKKYVYLLNSENYNLISTNPGPNSSPKSKGVRLKEIPTHIKNMYSRDSITIPSGETILNLEEDKKIMVSIGDVYDPIAMTYGERTGACLRIQGAFGDLFEYCLKDKNGFHIRFSDPETGEFISRVSGLRNGNTVFFNELRESVNQNYSSKELVKVLNRVAKMLVESTKNDPHPIENVVVSNDYAMKDELSEDLNIDKQEAFNGLNFNIISDGNVLYTANEENHKSLMPYKFGDKYTSEYRPYNTKVCRTGKKQCKEIINRVNMINEIMKGKTMDEIEMLEVDDAEKCIYGHGWVVYLDSENVIHELIIDKFKNDFKLRELIEENKEKHFGGVKHETSR